MMIHDSIERFSDEIERLGGTDNISLEEAKELIKKMVKVCYLRDCK